jgi:hypothetical protein
VRQVLPRQPPTGLTSFSWIFSFRASTATRPDNRQILRDLLTSADFEVIEAADGEALFQAAINRLQH